MLTAEQQQALLQQNQMLIQAMANNQIGQTYNNQEHLEKSNMLLNDLHTKAPASTMTAQNLHGLGGTFSTLGLDRDIMSTHVANLEGLAAKLPIFPSNDEDPRFGALTGFSDDIGNEPVEVCDPSPSGFLKACNLTAQYGRLARETETIEMDKLGLRVNRGDFQDLRLHGMNFPTGNAMMPGGLNKNQILNNVTMSQMVSVGVRIERKLTTTFWQGSPANNTLGGGYKEGPGLDVQIATGQVDADSGSLCPSLDSYVDNFNYSNIDGSGLNDISQFLMSMDYYIYTLAQDTGMLPAKWVIVMRPQLWYELSRVWPIIYNTDRVAIALANATNARVNIGGRENIEDRDSMRRLGQLALNGRTYDVVEDTGIFESNSTNDANLNPGEFSSSVYMVPMTVTSSFPVTYRNYVNYRDALLQQNVSLLNNKQWFWTDNGHFSWVIDQLRRCYLLEAKTEQRVVLRTPQLAGRLDNVMYAPGRHLREANPDSPYWVNGGVSIRSTPAKNAVWL